MSDENQNQDFEKLQRMLKLKRHEQPPPRYFNDFSSKVISGIGTRSRREKADSFEEIVSRSPLAQRVWEFLGGKPVLSGLCAASACGLIVGAMFYADNVPMSVPAIASTGDAGAKESPSTPSIFTGAIAGSQQLPDSLTPTAILPAYSLFNQSPDLHTRQVSWTNGWK